MNWTCEGLEVDEIPIDTPFGFIYRLTYEDGTMYIGKKQMFSKKTLPALKSGIQRPNSKRIGKNKNGKRVYFDVVYKESDWKKYLGSSEDTKDLVVTKKEILMFCKTKRSLTYMECKALFHFDTIESKEYRNKNINNLFFRDNIE